VKLFINDKERQLEASSLTISELLEKLNMPSLGLVADLDGEIVPNAEFSSKRLNEGSKIELIRIVGGG
jgi:thiamine biosynthesis protein ThiS